MKQFFKDYWKMYTESYNLGAEFQRKHPLGVIIMNLLIAFVWILYFLYCMNWWPFDSIREKISNVFKKKES